MGQSQAQAWEKFNENKINDNYPRWPNEVMVKLAFGSYLKNKIVLPSGAKVLDVGCGFGNNLLPFLAKGYDCSGTEITEVMAQKTQEIMEQRGYKTAIKMGTNQQLPFADQSFDLLLSLNVIHYEAGRDNVKKAFAEYKRVLKNGGRFILITVGPGHAILKEAKKLEPHVYEIHNYDFRNGVKFYGFDDQEHLRECLNESFSDVETGRIREDLMTLSLDFLVAAGQVRRS